MASFAHPLSRSKGDQGAGDALAEARASENLGHEHRADAAARIRGADPMSDESTLPDWQALLPEATSTVVPGAGHLAAFTAPDAVTAPMLELILSLSR